MTGLGIQRRLRHRPIAPRIGTHPRTLGALVLGALVTSVSPAVAQQVLLDAGVRAGELMVFPTMGTDYEPGDDYYYVHNEARLAQSDSGEPEFSFLRFVDVARPEAGEEVEREGEGGGIVHAVVQLAVEESTLREAENALRRLRPGARIVGPVIYRSGTFGLVSSFLEEDGDWTRRVVGLGKAPVLEGSRAAVSIRLTKQGSKILWESFQMPTPDISFRFEMEVAGLRSPTRVLLEADWDRIYNRQAFQVGIAGTFLAGEIAGEFDALRQDGAIRVVQVGQDEDMEKAVDVAYNKLLNIMFEPVEGGDLPGLEQMARQAGQPSVLDRASTLLASAREEARRRNQQLATATPAQRAAEPPTPARAGASEPSEASPRTSESPAVEDRRRDYEAALRSVVVQERRVTALVDRREVFQSLAAALESAPPGDGPAQLREAAAAADRALPEVDEEVREAEATLVTRQREADEAREALKEAEDQDRIARLTRERSREEAVDDAAASTTGSSGGGPDDGDRADRVREPSFAVVGALQLRRSRQSGTLRLDLNKYTPDTQVLPFSSNIGDLGRYLDDPEFFREVNLDQPLFRQRAVSFRLAGLDADDFGDYVNFVHVQLRRGDETREELTVGPEEFNRAGNDFPLIYGFSGQESRDQWQTYQYRTVWSFFAGLEVEQPWERSSAGAVALAPPLERRQIEVTSNPEDLQAAGARAVTVRLYYGTGEDERYSEVLLRPDRQIYAGLADVILPAGESEFQYETLWQLRGNEERTSGRLSSSASILFVDQVPQP